jgi:hypothetical protein
VTVSLLCLFNRWTAGYGQFVETVRLVAPDQTTVLCRQESRVFAGGGHPPRHQRGRCCATLKFEVAGPYYVEVLVDDVMKIRYPLVVHLLSPPPKPPEAK